MSEHETVVVGFSTSEVIWQTIGALAWAGLLAYFFGLLDTVLENLHVMLGKKGINLRVVQGSVAAKVEQCFSIIESTIRRVLRRSKSAENNHKEASLPESAQHGVSGFHLQPATVQQAADEPQHATTISEEQTNDTEESYEESYEEYVISKKAVQETSPAAHKRERRGSGGSELIRAITAGALDPILENPESGRLHHTVGKHSAPAIIPSEAPVQKSSMEEVNATESGQEVRRKSYSEWVPEEGRIPLMAFGL